jgi:hypothetical protein
MMTTRNQITSVLGVALLAMATLPGLCTAQNVIYTQDFDPGGTDPGLLSTVGWSALGNLESTGLNGDASAEAIEAGISSSWEYVFFAPHRGATLDNELFLAYTIDSSVNVDVSRLESVSYSYIGDPVDAVYRVAVQVGGVWYAEATGTADTRSNPGAFATFLSTTFLPASFAAAPNWVTVQNAAVGSAPMALGAAPGGDLSGTVTAIGLLLDGDGNNNGGEDHVRFDAFEVTAAPISATPGTVIMFK